MSTPGLNERFSRQVILPGVGVPGQEKWANTPILLAGEGAALEAAKTALETAGASKVIALSSESSNPLPSAAIAVIVTGNAEWRRKLNRQSRATSQPTVFAWPSASGYALFFARHRAGQCPCLECFEVMNPKAFTKGAPSVQRILGAMAASEALQWILNEESPLEGKVWITSLDEGVSLRHEVRATYKCPARLLEEGATVTP